LRVAPGPRPTRMRGAGCGQVAVHRLRCAWRCTEGGGRVGGNVEQQGRRPGERRCRDWQGRWLSGCVGRQLGGVGWPEHRGDSRQGLGSVVEESSTAQARSGGGHAWLDLNRLWGGWAGGGHERGVKSPNFYRPPTSRRKLP
jgi:hypothetical protein